MSETNYYTPGVCNLNLPEIAYRKKVSNISLAISVVLVVLFVAFSLPPVMGIVVFLPLWIGLLNYLQAKNKFCVMYAASGVYNKSDAYAETAEVADDKSRKLDKARARSMNVKALVGGIVGTALVVAVLALI